MAKVFANRQVAHVWAAQSQDEGRSANGNFSFRGAALYSYSTVIGRFVETIDGRRAVLINSNHYSMTTSSKHMPALRSALSSDILSFSVPDVDGNSWGHARNLASMVAVVTEAIERSAKVRFTSHDAETVGGWAYGKVDGFEGPRVLHGALYGIDKAQDYSTAFGVAFDPAPLVARVHAANEAFNARLAKWNDPKAVAKREREAAKREAARIAEEAAERAAQAVQAAEGFAAWKAGHGPCPSSWGYAEGSPELQAIDAHNRAEQLAGATEALAAFEAWKAGTGPRLGSAIRYKLPTAERAELGALEEARDLEAWKAGASVRVHATAPDGTAYVRARGDVLETSQGASVPLAHAIRVFRAVKALRKPDAAPTDVVWQRNGATLRVGHFQVDAIHADGSFRAGCHRIAWGEVERVAGALGLLDVPASIEAIEGGH
jgi:hypothetical protein